MLDIDDFAVFNDRFSFEAGDKLLKDLATHSKTSLPDNSLLARTGSEEFCVLINHPKSSGQSAKNLVFEKPTRFQTSSPNDISQEICLSIVVDSFD
jgi:diguanylate cyclase (GGDEF)-like protein